MRALPTAWRATQRAFLDIRLIAGTLLVGVTVARVERPSRPSYHGHARVLAAARGIAGYALPEQEARTPAAPPRICGRDARVTDSPCVRASPEVGGRDGGRAAGPVHP